MSSLADEPIAKARTPGPLRSGSRWADHPFDGPLQMPRSVLNVRPFTQQALLGTFGSMEEKARSGEELKILCWTIFSSMSRIVLQLRIAWRFEDVNII